MSDHEDLLGDDHSLTEYNLGNDEEEELLADDYENSTSQNVPTSAAAGYSGRVNMVRTEYSSHSLAYTPQPVSYPVVTESECVVPNIIVEAPKIRLPEHSTYAPYTEPPVYEAEHAVVPPPIPAAPAESPQIVPSEVTAPLNGDLGIRERFTSERPPGVQRTPQVRDIPDSLDKVFVPRGGFGARARNSWRNPQYRNPYPYRRNNMHRSTYTSRPSLPPPQVWSNPPSTPQIRQNIPEIRPEILQPKMEPDVSPETPILPQELPIFRSQENRFPPQNYPRFPQFRPNDEPRPFVPNVRPNFEPRPAFQFQTSYPRYPPVREIGPSANHIPQITIHQHPVPSGLPKMDRYPPKISREPEVRMLPMHLPPNIPPGGLAGKKVLINPHFKGNFQPPVEGLPTYIPTRIQKTPPLSPTLEIKFGPIKDIDDAAERFIAEQRNALARAANRKIARRSPQRYIENTTIEIENEFARRSEDEELLRRQEEFINANRAGLRRRMRSPSPVRRSPSPRRSPPRRPRTETHDEDSEYRRRLREQESLRERVLRAKEVRRRKNAVALQKQLQDSEHDKQENDKEIPPKPDSPKVDIQKSEIPKIEDPKPVETSADNKPSSTQPDTTRKSPEQVKIVDKVEIVRERSPVRAVMEEAEVNSTCENLTPPREEMPHQEKPRLPSMDREPPLTPPLPTTARDRLLDSDDELDLILGDIDGILSDDDDTGRFKEKKELEQAKQDKPVEPPKQNKVVEQPKQNRTVEQPKQNRTAVDLRSKLAVKTTESKAPRQKIVFNEQKDERKKKDKSPVRRTVVTSSTKADDDNAGKKVTKARPKGEAAPAKPRTRIIFDKKEPEKQKEEEKTKAQTFPNRRVVLQRKPNQTVSMGIFTRAVRTALGNERTPRGPRAARGVPRDEPHVEYASDSDGAETSPPHQQRLAHVDNLPHGITDTRLKTLAGDDVQSLILDKEDRSAKITFKTTAAADNFRRKFNNKMVAASRLTVTLR